MTDATRTPTGRGSAPSGSPLSAIARVWRGLSPSLVPFLAVITALIVAIPLLVFTRGEGDLGRGLQVSGTAYASLLEGSVGLAVNRTLSADDVAFALDYIQGQDAVAETPLDFPQMRLLAQRAEELADVGRDNVDRYAEVIARYMPFFSDLGVAETVTPGDLTPDTLDEIAFDNAAFDLLGDLVPDIQRIGPQRLRDYEAFVLGLNELDDLGVGDVAELVVADGAIDADERFQLETFAPAASDVDDDGLLAVMGVVAENRMGRLSRLVELAVALDELAIPEADLTDIDEIGQSALINNRALFDALDESGDTAFIAPLLADLGEATEFTEDQRATVEDALPVAADFEDSAVIESLTLADAYPLDRLLALGDLVAQVEADYPNALAINANSIESIAEIGPERMVPYRALYAELAELDRSGFVPEFTDRYGSSDIIDDDLRAEIEVFVPQAAEYSDTDLFEAIQLLVNRRLVRLTRAYEQTIVLDTLELDAFSDDAEAIASIHSLTTDREDPDGAQIVLRLAEVDAQFQAGGVAEDDISRLAGELRLITNLYGEEVLPIEVPVATAVAESLAPAIENNLIVLRPRNQILVHDDRDSVFGIIETTRNDTVTVVDDEGNESTDLEAVTVPDKVFLHIGSTVVLFSPSSVESTLLRSIPYIIAGLAVALGFKAGLFNIGAQGQLFIGATLAVWIGYQTAFADVPGFILVPLIMMAGLLGGAFWGMIPGALKAYTGAHEVITTIMLNFIAIRLIEWLIRTEDPVILRDPQASVDRTPNMLNNARLASFDEIGIGVFLVAGIAMFLFSAYARRADIQKDTRHLIRPAVYGLLVFIGGVVLNWMTVQSLLHIGFALMIITVLVVDWFLNRTTYGFELRTVGSNADAARYAGMSVRQNTVLALTISGALAGLAGIIAISGGGQSGVEYHMAPELFTNLGFDAIAVALLARNNPRNMIWAGLLWGGLLAGSGLMQANADIGVNLVQIIQSLIIMFIAADAIIRTVWLIPEPTPEEKARAVITKGWGG